MSRGRDDGPWTLRTLLDDNDIADLIFAAFVGIITLGAALGVITLAVCLLLWPFGLGPFPTDPCTCPGALQ